MFSITLREVAARAGVSVSTASAALNDLDIVREATRKRVHQAAEELGYRKDASGAVLVARRRSHGGVAARARLALAYLRGPQATHRHSEGFEAQAAKLGYSVEWTDLAAFHGPEAAARALWNRGVAGIFHSTPGAVPADPSWVDKFDWSRFAVVKSTRARPELRFHRIRHDAYEYAARTLQEVHARGYRRLAVILGRSAVPTDDEARLGAVLAWDALHRRPGTHLEWTLDDGSASRRDRLDAWLRCLRPDAVVAFPESIYWDLVTLGWKIPGDLAFAAIVMRDGSELAGCLASHGEMAATAVHLLDQQIKTGARGMVTYPHEHVVAPTWQDGPSLPNPAHK